MKISKKNKVAALGASMLIGLSGCDREERAEGVSPSATLNHELLGAGTAVSTEALLAEREQVKSELSRIWRALETPAEPPHFGQSQIGNLQGLFNRLAQSEITRVFRPFENGEVGVHPPRYTKAVQGYHHEQGEIAVHTGPLSVLQEVNEAARNTRTQFERIAQPEIFETFERAIEDSFEQLRLDVEQAIVTPLEPHERLELQADFQGTILQYLRSPERTPFEPTLESKLSLYSSLEDLKNEQNATSIEGTTLHAPLDLQVVPDEVLVAAFLGLGSFRSTLHITGELFSSHSGEGQFLVRQVVEFVPSDESNCKVFQVTDRVFGSLAYEQGSSNGIDFRARQSALLGETVRSASIEGEDGEAIGRHVHFEEGHTQIRSWKASEKTKPESVAKAFGNQWNEGHYPGFEAGEREVEGGRVTVAQPIPLSQLFDQWSDPTGTAELPHDFQEVYQRSLLNNDLLKSQKIRTEVIPNSIALSELELLGKCFILLTSDKERVTAHGKVTHPELFGAELFKDRIAELQSCADIVAQLRFEEHRLRQVCRDTYQDYASGRVRFGEEPYPGYQSALDESESLLQEQRRGIRRIAPLAARTESLGSHEKKWTSHENWLALDALVDEQIANQLPERIQVLDPSRYAAEAEDQSFDLEPGTTRAVQAASAAARTPDGSDPDFSELRLSKTELQGQSSISIYGHDGSFLAESKSPQADFSPSLNELQRRLLRLGIAEIALVHREGVLTAEVASTIVRRREVLKADLLSSPVLSQVSQLLQRSPESIDPQERALLLQALITVEKEGLRYSEEMAQTFDEQALQWTDDILLEMGIRIGELGRYTGVFVPVERTLVRCSTPNPEELRLAFQRKIVATLQNLTGVQQEDTASSAAGELADDDLVLIEPPSELKTHLVWVAEDEQQAILEEELSAHYHQFLNAFVQQGGQ